MNAAAKILIVDDNPEIHEILEKIFTIRGKEGAKPIVLHAENGQDALDKLAVNQDVDVIILDLDMPVMNGFETLIHLKGDLRFRSIPVCVFSGCKADSVKALELGARDFINKPSDYMEMELRVLNLIEIKRQVEASERAKLNFLSTVSHELRTPMNGVLGMTQLLQMTEMTAEQTEYLETLEQSANGMMAMINNVISFLGSENPLYHHQAVPFSLRATLQKSVDGLNSEAAAGGVTLITAISPDIPDNLIGLPDKIQLIFSHLLSNSIKFSPAGKVSVGIESGGLVDTTIRLRCSVNDTGIGISQEIQSNIFEPFTQADSTTTRKFGGLGIGLSIASRIVQMMGGSLTVESSPGGGSTFNFEITCSLDNADQIA